jgi:hypothetical protein
VITSSPNPDTRWDVIPASDVDGRALGKRARRELFAQPARVTRPRPAHHRALRCRRCRPRVPHRLGTPPSTPHRRPGLTGRQHPGHRQPWAPPEPTDHPTINQRARAALKWPIEATPHTHQQPSQTLTPRVNNLSADLDLTPSRLRPPVREFGALLVLCSPKTPLPPFSPTGV